MLGKRALVVDDSRSARVILRKMLEQYDLEVDTAESAEEAIDYLRHRRPDAIFMDHNMPGMDGLQAVKIIKDDPKTATIPIMMYTSREGEVYVGQARALGALGILPKQVEPAELFKILRRINLVPERRRGPSDTPSADDEGTGERLPELPLAVIDEIVRIAVDTAEASHSTRRAQLKQLFEIQRERFQQDLQTMQQTVTEDFQRQLEAHLGTGEVGNNASSRGNSRRRMAMLGMAAVLMLLLIPIVWLSNRYDAAETALAGAQAQIVLLKQKEQIVDARQVQKWLATFNAEHSGMSGAALNNAALLKAVEWALNRGGTFGFDGPALGDTQKEMLQGLLSYLESAGFRGEVRLNVHFGDFCLVADASGGLELAPPDLPIEECDVIGRPSEPRPGLAGQQSIAFGSFLASSPLVNNGDIQIVIEPVQGETPDSALRHQSSAATAGEWNRVAQLDNRIEISLVPEARE